MIDTLIANKSLAGLYYLPPAKQAELEMATRRTSLRVLAAQIAEHMVPEDVLASFARDFQLPIWYGANFDALADCLSDPGWRAPKGDILLIKGMAHLRTANPEDFATLIEVFRTVAAEHHDENAPLWILIDTPARGVPALPEA